VGVRRASLIFSGFVVAGAAMVAAAPSLPVLYAGRVLFGIGSESMIVAQSAITARWFTGKELAMAFGITLTIARLGTLFSFNTEELLATRFGWRGALWIAARCACSACSATGSTPSWIATPSPFCIFPKPAPATRSPGATSASSALLLVRRGNLRDVLLRYLPVHRAGHRLLSR
jgi:MFS family permease